MKNYHLFTPGPTPIPDRVIKRMSETILYHRGNEFREIFKQVNDNLKYLFQTNQPVLTFACSGTGGMEATFQNLFSAGDTIISVNSGKFGERWVVMPRAFGLTVIELKLDWGETPKEELIAAALEKHKNIKAVYLTHCETSTGTATDIKNLARVIKENSDALICVDGISAVGGLELRFDEWGIDVCVTASQKGLMLPPGLAFVALSRRAINFLEQSDLKKFYFDFTKALIAHEKNDTPWTPAISLITGLEEALLMIKEEGVENVWSRHTQNANMLRYGIQKLKLNIFSKFPSDTVTAIVMPKNLDWEMFNDVLREKYYCIVGKGQGDFKGKIFRIGHIGFSHEDDIRLILNCLEHTLLDCN